MYMIFLNGKRLPFQFSKGDNENVKADTTVTDKVYFDMTIGGKPAGRIVIGMFFVDNEFSILILISK